jgi:hypothetical protein
VDPARLGARPSPVELPEPQPEGDHVRRPDHERLEQELSPAHLVAAENRAEEGDQRHRIAEPHVGDQAEGHGAPTARLHEPLARSRPGQEDQQDELRGDQRQPDPPREPPERPALLAADDADQDLQAHHRNDGQGGLQPRLELGLAELVPSHG